MTTTYQKIFLSASTSGKPINITATTSGSPTTLHTAHASNIDELWLKVFNTGLTTQQLTLCLGGTAAHEQLTVSIPGNFIGEVPVLMGQPFSQGVVVSAFASTTSVLSVMGFVNRIVVI